MGGKYINCHDLPGGSKCVHSVTLSAGNEKDLLELAGRHGMSVHGLANTGEFRKTIIEHMKEGSPPA